MSTYNCDKVLYNADIITMEPNNPSAEMLGIKNDKILYIGEYNSKILDKANSANDMSGKTILPGFIDLHTHLWKESHVISIDLGEYNTYSDVLNRIKKEVSTRKPGEWVFASNWDESKWKDRKEFLKLEDLDFIAPNNPVFTHREDGHLCVANTLALEQLSIKDHSGVEKDFQGKPTGILKDVWLDLSSYYKNKIPESIEKSAYNAISKGITAVVDNLTITPEGQKNVMNAYFMLDFYGKLPIRVFLNPTRELMKEFIKIGLLRNWGSPMVRFSGFKGFFDGALGAKTALLTHPYDDNEGTGEQFINEEELISQITFAEINDLTMCIHAIGDLAIEKLLDCYEKGIINAGKEKTNQKHRIEHAEMITDNQIKKAEKLGIILSMQPNFLKWEYSGGLYEQRIGKNRFNSLNRFARILQFGGQLNFGSDNMPLSPFFGIQQAVSYPSTEIKIPLREAIKGYTINNAKALFMESMIGSLKVGKYADFVILRESPLKIDLLKLRDDLVEKTIVGGIEVYSSLR